jgi:hypothetical protein
MSDVPVEEAFARAVKRAHGNGRFLPWQFLVETHEQVAMNHLGWRRMTELDSWQLLSNDVPFGAPKILMAQGGGGILTIMEEELYAAFLEKAAGYHGPGVNRPATFKQASP